MSHIDDPRLRELRRGWRAWVYRGRRRASRRRFGYQAVGLALFMAAHLQ